MMGERCVEGDGEMKGGAERDRCPQIKCATTCVLDTLLCWRVGVSRGLPVLVPAAKVWP